MRFGKRWLALFLSLVLLLGFAPAGQAAGGGVPSPAWSIVYDADEFGFGELAVEIYDGGENRNPLVSWSEEPGCIRADRASAALFSGEGPFYAVLQRKVEGSGLAGMSEEEIDAEFRKLYESIYGPVQEPELPEGWPNETGEAALRWYASILADEDFLAWYDEEWGGDLYTEEEILEEAEWMTEDYPEEFPTLDAAVAFVVRSSAGDAYFEYCGYDNYLQMAQYKRSILESAIQYPDSYPGYTPPAAGESYTAVAVLPLDGAAQQSGLLVSGDAFADCVPLEIATPEKAEGSDPYGYDYGYGASAAVDPQVLYLIEGLAIPVYIETGEEGQFPGYGWEDEEEDDYPADPYGDAAEEGGRLTGLVPAGSSVRFPQGRYCVAAVCGAGILEEGDALLDWEIVDLGAGGGSVDLSRGRSLVRLDVGGGALAPGYALSELSIGASPAGIPGSSFRADLFSTEVDFYSGEVTSGLHGLRLKPGSYDLYFSVAGSRNSYSMDMLEADWQLAGPAELRRNTSMTLPALSPSDTEYSVSLAFLSAEDGGEAPFRPGEALLGELRIQAGQFLLLSASAARVELGMGGGEEADYDFVFSMLTTTAAFEGGETITPPEGSLLTSFALTAPAASRRVNASAELVGDGFPALRFAASALLAVGEGADVTPPATPAGFRCEAEGEALCFSWTENGEADLAGYRLYRTDAEGYSAALLGSLGKNDASILLDVDRNAWGDGPWYFSLSALDESGNESPRCAPLRMADPALPLEGTGSWSVENGTLRDGVFYLTEAGEGSLSLGFLPAAGTDPSDLPGSLSAVLKYRDLSGAAKETAAELSLRAGSYAGSLPLGSDAADLEQLSFRTGDLLLDTLDLQRIPVAALLRVSLPAPEAYPLVSAFYKATVASLLGTPVELTPGENGFSGYVRRDYYRNCMLRLWIGYQPESIPGSLLDLGLSGDSVTLSPSVLPELMRLRVSLDRDRCGVICVAAFSEEDETWLSALPGEGTSDFYIWREDASQERVRLRLLPCDDLYGLTVLSGEDLLAEEGIPFVKGADLSVSCGVGIRDLEQYMYLDLRCGRDGTGIPLDDVTLQLTSETGESFLCNWYAALGVLDTSALEAGAHYRVGLPPELDTAFGVSELTVTALQDGSNELGPHPVLTLLERAAVGFSAFFFSDELGVPGGIAQVTPIVPEFDVFFKHRRTGEWTLLPGITTVRSAFPDGGAEGICVGFMAAGLDREILDTEAGLKLVFTGKGYVCEENTPGTSHIFHPIGEPGGMATMPDPEPVGTASGISFARGVPVLLRSGQVFYTVPTQGDSGNIVARDLMSSVTDLSDGVYDRNYLSGGSAGTGHFPTILQWVISGSDPDSGCVIRGLQLMEAPKLRLRLGRTAAPTEFTLLLRSAEDGWVYRYPLYLEYGQAGSSQEFELPDLPLGRYDLLLYLGGGLDCEQLQRQFAEGETVVLPQSVCGTYLTGVLLTGEDPVMELELPEAPPEAGVPGIQGISVLPDRDSALTGDRIRFTVHLSCVPGGAEEQRTLHFLSDGDRFAIESWSCVFTRADGSRVTLQRLSEGTFLFPEDGQLIRGSVTVSGLVKDGADSHATLEVWEGERTYGHSKGRCYIEPFMAIIPENIPSGSAVVSGRGGGAGADLTLRATSLEHPEATREQTVTVSRYGYWKGALEYPLSGAGEAETFRVEVLSAGGEVLAEGLSSYAGAAEDVLPTVVRIIYSNAGIRTVLTGYPGERKDFASLNSAVMTFGGDFGFTKIRVEMEFDDSSPDAWGLTDARRVYAPVLSLRANRRDQPIYFEFYPTEQKSFDLNAEELDLALEDVPYASAYYAEFPDYYLGAILGLGYELSPGREERLVSAPAGKDFLSYSRRELGRTDTELRRIADAFSNIETALTADGDGVIEARSSYEGTLESLDISFRCEDVDPASLREGADPEATVFGSDPEGTPFRWTQTLRLEALDEAAAAALGGEDYYVSGAAGPDYRRTFPAGEGFLRQLRVDNRASLIPGQEGVTLRMESTLHAVVDVRQMEGPEASLLSAWLQESGAGYYVDMALGVVSDILGEGVNDLLEKGSEFVKNNKDVAKNLNIANEVTTTAVNIAGIAKTGYDEVTQDRGEAFKAKIQTYKDRLSRLRASLSRLCNCGTAEDRAATAALNAMDREAQAKLDEISMEIDEGSTDVGCASVLANGLAATGVPFISTAATYIVDTTVKGQAEYIDFLVTKSCEQVVLEYEGRYRSAVSVCDNSKCEKADVPLRTGGYITSWDDFPDAHVEVTPKKILDPSGIVYEGMLSNPLEGVTCSIEYLDEEAGEWRLWEEAEEFNDQNPVWITGPNGYYHWDVPEGRWRVKYHKDGYNGGDTLLSGEMEVPPVWLDVNQPMECPDAFTARATLTETGVSLRFTRPVQASEVPERVALYRNRQKVDCVFTPQLLEEGLAQSFTAVLEPELNAAYEVTVTDLRSYLGTEASFTVPVDASGLTDPDQCPPVTADVLTGSTLSFGTSVTLRCPLEGAEIWYTTDGSCPCVESSPSRKHYDGPITVTEDTYLIAYAVKPGMKDSGTKAFIYFCDEPEETVSGRACADAHSVTAALWVDLAGADGYCDVVLSFYCGGKYAGMCVESGVDADKADSASICKRFVSAAELRDVTVKVLVLRSGSWLPLLPASVITPDAPG